MRASNTKASSILRTLKAITGDRLLMEKLKAAIAPDQEVLFHNLGSGSAQIEPNAIKASLEAVTEVGYEGPDLAVSMFVAGCLYKEWVQTTRETLDQLAALEDPRGVM